MIKTVGYKTVNGERVALTADVPPEPPPKLSPIQFKLCFTAAERVAIRTAADTDAVIADFWEIVNDPRLTHVDLGLQSTLDAIDYLTAQGHITADRAEQIKAGQML